VEGRRRCAPSVTATTSVTDSTTPAPPPPLADPEKVISALRRVELPHAHSGDGALDSVITPNPVSPVFRARTGSARNEPQPVELPRRPSDHVDWRQSLGVVIVAEVTHAERG